MHDSLTFAADVTRTISERLATKVTELSLLVETRLSLQSWLAWEAFLACKQRQEAYPYGEVVAQPTYASENVMDAHLLGRRTGDLRVGGPDDGANHCWAFMEMIDLHVADADSLRTIAMARERLLQLGWKKSAALLAVLAVDSTTHQLANIEWWQQPTLILPTCMVLPTGDSLLFKVFDIKRNPADTLICR